MRSSSLATVSLLCAAASFASADQASFTATSIDAPFIEQFDEGWDSRWSASEAVKQTPANGETFSYVGVWSVEEPSVYPGIPEDKGLVMKSKAAHHAISAPFPSPIDPSGKQLVVQYEVKLQKGLECGGAYMKLLSEAGVQAPEFADTTPWVVMFGPDSCGTTNKVHFIFRFKNPITGEYEEKHLTSAPAPKKTKTSALYTLIVNPDNTFEILINDESVKTGSLLEDFDPAVNPPTLISDPLDTKPSTWIDTPRIIDPLATKPIDWDEDAPASIVDEAATMPEGWLEDAPATIPDPESEKPEEWDDEEDGDWIAASVVNPLCEEAPGCGPWSKPMIANPEYKGKWTAPMIDNPEYIGAWEARKIANPDYYEEKNPSRLEPIAGVGFELWTMTEDILFDNIYIGHSAKDAKAFAKETFHVKEPIEKAAEGLATKNDDDESVISQSGSKVEQFLRDARGRVERFIDSAKHDPIAALKEAPEIPAALLAILLTTLLTLAGLSSLLGGSSPAKTPIKETIKKKELVTDEIKAVVPETAPAAVGTATGSSSTEQEPNAVLIEEVVIATPVVLAPEAVTTKGGAKKRGAAAK